ncbi:MAG: ArsR/SmtB family transcription factor [Methanobacterium sp.]
MTSYILKEIFRDTKRVRILEELLERWGEYLSVAELERMTDISSKTLYTHLSELEKIGLVILEPGNKSKYAININDRRALILGILQDEEYLRKVDLSIKETEKEELVQQIDKAVNPEVSFTEYFSSSIKDVFIPRKAYNLRA